MNSKFYKYCAVPMCHNTTIKTPKKLFIHVPPNKKIRKQWFLLAKRDKPQIAKNIYYCEDHFDMPNDMENFMEYRIMGSVSQIRMKPNCLPTKFDCQSNRKSTSDISTPTSVKRQNISLIEQCIKENRDIVIKKYDEDNEAPNQCSELQQQKNEVLKVNIGIQVNMKPKYRSKCTQTSFIFQHNKQTSPIEIPSTSVSTSPTKCTNKTKRKCDDRYLNSK